MNATSERVLRDQLLYLLRGGNAHGSLGNLLEGFPEKMINTVLPGTTYTPWRLLEHIRIAQWDILEFVRDPDHVSPPWPEGYWPAVGEGADSEKWRASVAGYQADLEALQELVEDLDTDLFGPLPHAPGYTVLREVLLAADHNAYHTGEFGLLLDLVRKRK